jgi:hypothetical protein
MLASTAACDPYRKSRLLTNGCCYVAKHPPVPAVEAHPRDRRVVDHGLVVDVGDGDAAEIVEGTAINSNRAKHLSGALSLHPGNAMPTRKGHRFNTARRASGVECGQPSLGRCS